MTFSTTAIASLLLSIAAIAIVLALIPSSTHERELLSVITNPEEVIKANKFIAPDQTVRVLYNTIDDTRDVFQQLRGSLAARSKDEDCDAIHAIAGQVRDAHQRFELLELQYKRLDREDRQAVAAYVQEKLIGVVHEVTTGLVVSLLRCEQSEVLYHQAVANIRLLAAKLDMYEKRVYKNEASCPELQKVFHDAMQDIKEFHIASDKILQDMRQKNMIVAADQAQLERAARTNPAEHSFYSTYGTVWARSCHTKVNAALGLNPDGSAASSGSASGASSGASGSSGSGGSK